MRRQLHTGNPDIGQQVASSQQLSAGRSQLDMPANTGLSGMHADHTYPLLKPKKGIEPWRSSMSERKLRATEFAARVHSLKYYIGLIGAKSII